MDTAFAPEDIAFRDEVAEFFDTAFDDDIAARISSPDPAVFPAAIVEWQKRLFDRGWIAPGWPAEYGGTGWDDTKCFIFETERAKRGIREVLPFGLKMVGPVIYTFGNDEQKARFLPKILASDEWWCQGYSEPGAGSDLASLKTRAVRDGDDYIVNGAKIWTSYAQFADWIFCLVRTSTEGKKQQGISFLLIDMKTPGIKVNPIVSIDAHHSLNEVEFNDVRVPVANLIGEENKGWTYAKYLLEFERGGGFAGPLVLHELSRLQQLYRDTQAAVRNFDSNRELQRKIARIEIDLKALEITELRILSAVSGGGNPGPESSILKLNTTRLEQEINQLSVDILGYRALEMDPVEGGSPYRPDSTSAVLPRYLNNRAASIFGGSQEVQRNIIAKMVLGL